MNKKENNNNNNNNNHKDDQSTYSCLTLTWKTISLFFTCDVSTSDIRVRSTLRLISVFLFQQQELMISVRRSWHMLSNGNTSMQINIK